MTKSRAPVISRVRCPSAAVLAYAGEAVGKGPGEQVPMEQLPRVLLAIGRPGRPRSGGRTNAGSRPRSRRSSASNDGASPRRPATKDVRSSGGEVAAGQPGVGVHHVGGDERVLEVEDREVPLGRQDGPPGPLGALVHHRPTGGSAHPRVLDHRGEVDVVHVVVPVDHRRVEAEPGAVGFVGALPQLDAAGRPGNGPRSRCRRRRARRSRGPVGQRVAVLEPGREGGLTAPQRQGGDQSLGRGHEPVGLLELALDPSSAGERPLGHVDRLALLVVHGVAAEPVLAQLDEPAVAQRVPDTRGHLV